MSKQEKIIASLEQKGLLDKSSITKLRTRLKRKLKTEAKVNEKEMTALKAELSKLHAHLVN